MYLSLTLWLISIFIDYYVYNKLLQAGISKFSRVIFLCWDVFWFLMFVNSWLVSKFYSRRLAEILGGLAITWIIITLLAFFAFFGIDLITGFKIFTRKKVFLSVILTLTGVTWCLSEAYFVQKREIIIKTNKLSYGIDKIRIAYLTDLHLGGIYTSFHFDRVMKIIEDSKPDIFILCGDIFDGDMTYWTQEISRLSQAAKRASYGAFAVNGNHEILHLLKDDFETLMRDLNFNLLIDQRADTAGIIILGVEDRKNKFNSYIKYLLAPEDAKKFVLVLKHRPFLPVDSENNFDLQLSGHTHGGQFWPMGYVKSWQEGGIPQGLSQKNGGYIYVSNGAGYNGPCMRLFTPPEVDIIDIVRE